MNETNYLINWIINPIIYKLIINKLDVGKGATEKTVKDREQWRNDISLN